MVQVLLCDMKRSYWRRSIVIREVSFLLGEIELLGVLRDGDP